MVTVIASPLFSCSPVGSKLLFVVTIFTFFHYHDDDVVVVVHVLVVLTLGNIRSKLSEVCVNKKEDLVLFSGLLFGFWFIFGL